MKSFRHIIAFIASMIAIALLQGCYTQFGPPESESPEKERYERYGDRYEDETVEDSGYYSSANGYSEEDSSEYYEDDRGVENRYYIYDEYADIYYDPYLFDPDPSVNFNISFGDPFWGYHPRYRYYPRYYRYTTYHRWDPFWNDPWDYAFFCPPYYGPSYGYYYPGHYDPWHYGGGYYGGYGGGYYGGGTYVSRLPNNKRDWERRRPSVDRGGGSSGTFTSGDRASHTDVGSAGRDGVSRPPVIINRNGGADRTEVSTRKKTTRRVVTRKKNPRSNLDKPQRSTDRRRTAERSSDSRTTGKKATSATSRRRSDRSYRGSTSSRKSKSSTRSSSSRSSGKSKSSARSSSSRSSGKSSARSSSSRSSGGSKSSARSSSSGSSKSSGSKSSKRSSKKRD